jgi:hypothetical protein
MPEVCYTRLTGGVALKSNAWDLIYQFHNTSYVNFIQLIDMDGTVLSYHTVGTLGNVASTHLDNTVVRLDDNHALLCLTRSDTSQIEFHSILATDDSAAVIYSTTTSISASHYWLSEWGTNRAACLINNVERDIAQIIDLQLDDNYDFESMTVQDLNTVDAFLDSSIAGNGEGNFIIGATNKAYGIQNNGNYYGESGEIDTGILLASVGACVINHDSNTWFMSNPIVGTGLWTVMINSSATDRPISGIEHTLTYVDMAVANNLCYMTPNVKKTDGYTLWDIGITSPAEAPTATTATITTTHTLDSGVYTYKYAYYDPTFGIESGASEESDQVTFTTQLGGTVGVVVPDDSQITQIRLYRRRADLFEIYHYLVDEYDLDKTLTYQTVTDEHRDSEVSNILISSDYVDTPDGAKYLAWHQNRMFYVLKDTELAYSEINVPDQINADNFINVGSHGDGRIIGLVPYKLNLFILKEKSIYILQGDGPVNFNLYVLSPNVGCVGHRAHALANNRLYFVATDDVYMSEGSAPQPVAPGLREFFKGFEEPREDYCWA